jgi:PAS domain S-box-containing protein
MIADMPTSRPKERNAPPPAPQDMETPQQLAQLAAIVNMAVDAIITIDERGLITTANPATERLFGYAASELVGRNVSMLMPQPYSAEHDGYLANYLSTGIARIIGIGREVSGMKRDGTIFPMSLAVSEVRLGNQRMFTGIVHDLTGRRRLEREVLLAATNEQRRIGHELHDGVCQDLAGLSMGLGLVARKLAAKGLTAEADSIRKLDDSVRATADQARKLAHGLNPVDIEAGGLPGALELLAAQLSAASGVTCHFHWDQRAQAPDAAAATHLYRIAQEAIGNAVRHGKPTRIDLHLIGMDGQLILRLEDDGHGLPAAHYAPSPEGQPARPTNARPSRPAGIGMHTMNYRARVIGATFDIRPRPDGGTVVTCSLRHQSA